MITPDKLTTLIQAAEARGVADSAEAEALEGGVAKAINHAANTGECHAKWVGIMTNALRTKLESYGYKVEPAKDANLRDVSNVYIISF